MAEDVINKSEFSILLSLLCVIDSKTPFLHIFLFSRVGHIFAINVVIYLVDFFPLSGYIK